jgi:putative salt-induced outer membrane protein
VLGVGYSFFPESDTLSFKIELGAGERQDEWAENIAADPDNNVVPGQTLDETIAYFSDEFVWKFSEGAELGQSLNVEYGKDNTVSRFEVYTKAQLVAALSMKVSYEVKYTDVVPEGTEDKDTKANVSLLYSF